MFPQKIIRCVLLRMLFVHLTGGSTITYSACPSPCTCKDNEDVTNMMGSSVVVLDCKDKGLTDIPDLSSMKNFTIHRLYLDNNQITNIPDNAFKDLRVMGIEMSDNPLSRIAANAFKGLEYDLEYLSMQRIKLSHPPHVFLGGLRYLQTLDLSGTTTSIMTTLGNHDNGTFGTLRMLEVLILSECGITSIHEKAFDGVESIMELKLDGNRLNEVPAKALRPLIDLVTLNLDQNQISGIPRNSFVSLINLQKLSLSDNKISNHKNIESAAFRGIGHNLMELDLSFNQMKELPTHSFDNLFNLGTFKISDNEIMRLNNGSFEKMTHLMTLDLSGNPVQVSYAALRGMEMSLVNLRLARTELSSVDKLPLGALKRFRYLRELDLSGNQLEILKNGTFSGLTLNRIILSNSGITTVEPGTFSNTMFPIDVELNINEITSLDFVLDPCEFQTLELTRNPIDCDCDFLKLVSLQTTTYKGQCATPEDAADLDFDDAAAKSELVERCQIGNQTMVKCAWMTASANNISVSTTLYTLMLICGIIGLF